MPENEPWYELALKVLGSITLFTGFFALIWNRTRKQAAVSISKTEGEIYKHIIENKLAEINITEVIEKKVEAEIEPLRNMLWNREIEHYEVKRELQERLMRVLDDKSKAERENEILHNESAIMQKELSSLRKQVEQMQKEIEILKKQQDEKKT